MCPCTKTCRPDCFVSWESFALSSSLNSSIFLVSALSRPHRLCFGSPFCHWGLQLRISRAPINKALYRWQNKLRNCPPPHTHIFCLLHITFCEGFGKTKKIRIPEPEKPRTQTSKNSAIQKSRNPEMKNVQENRTPEKEKSTNPGC